MFTRLRQTIHILTSKNAAEDHNYPDVIFAEERPPQSSRVSKAIAVSITTFAILNVVSRTVDFIGHAISSNSQQVKVSVSVGTLSGIVAVILFSLWDRQVRSWIDSLLLSLRITERLAPCFGHRLEKTYHALRGH